MARIQGIKEIKDNRGGLTHVVIDARKHPEAVGKLKEMGLVEKTQFEKDCEGAMSVEDAKQQTLEWLREEWHK